MHFRIILGPLVSGFPTSPDLLCQRGTPPKFCNRHPNSFILCLTVATLSDHGHPARQPIRTSLPPAGAYGGGRMPLSRSLAANRPLHQLQREGRPARLAGLVLPADGRLLRYRQQGNGCRPPASASFARRGPVGSRRHLALHAGHLPLRPGRMRRGDIDQDFGRSALRRALPSAGMVRLCRNAGQGMGGHAPPWVLRPHGMGHR